MSWRRQLAKFSALFRRRKPVDDLEEEIRSHLEMEEQENLESGMTPEEAHYAALRRFGNMTLVQERSREMGDGIGQRRSGRTFATACACWPRIRASRRWRF
jgi:hypothetical protein